ncbi:hypothetical protein [Convivina praedatoris]|uniref:hypothetical protein n=1 Tax=Convivina praedatoris TaxID=2880963 RepID=UPI00200CF900|nr:hypothetical protein [Convivina sp. LMG 32447]CAH1855109.1 hypothetical protein R078138_01061 [Convivina sp. LMG 32447]
MSFNSLISRLSAIKSRYDSYSLALKKAGIIDDIPTFVFNVGQTEYNEVAFQQLWRAFYLAKNRINWLITTTNGNGFTNKLGNFIDVVDFKEINQVNGDNVQANYLNQVAKMENILDQLQAVLTDSKIL